MFFRRIVTKRNGKKYTYLKLIESYREGGKVKQRVIANLGNIDNLDPEKINSLITSLNKLAEPDIPDMTGTISEKQATQEHHSPQIDIADLHHLWHKLGLSDFLYRTTARKSMDKVPWLIKAMAFQKLLFPAEHRPISVSYRVLNFPELQGQKITGTDFYQAAVSLAGIKEQLEIHLFEVLQKDLGSPPMLYTTLIKSEYTGHECDINTAGTAYQIRPYKKPLDLLVSVFPPDIPLSCIVCDKGFEGKDITTTRQELGQRLATKTCMVIDARNVNTSHSSIPSGDYFIKSLPPEDFAVIPVSTGDLWQDRDAFTVDNTLWVKDINKPEKRYIICHDLHPNTKYDQTLEQTLARAEQELEKISSLVKQRRLRREKTISGKINETLKKHSCQGYFNFRLNLESQDLKFSRNEGVIRKLKTLQRTQVLETNIRAIPALDIVNNFQNRGEIRETFRLITDPTKVPVMHSFTEFKHNRDYITGQALVHMLSCILEKLVSKNVVN